MKEELLRLFSDYLEDIEYLNQEQKLMLMQLSTKDKNWFRFAMTVFFA